MSIENNGGMSSPSPYQYYGSEAQVLGDQFRATMRAKDQAAQHARDLNSTYDNGWNDAMISLRPQWNALHQQIEAQKSRIAELERKVLAIAADRDEALVVIDEWADHSDKLKARNAEIVAQHDAAVAERDALAEVVTSLREANDRLQQQLQMSINELRTEKHAHAQHLLMHERSMIFVGSIVDAVQEILNEPDTEAAKVLKSRFGESHYNHLENAICLGVIDKPLQDDLLFRSNYPHVSGLIVKLLEQVGQSMSPADLDPSEMDMTGDDVDPSNYEHELP